MNRDVKTELLYREYRKSAQEDGCVFCSTPEDQIKFELKYFLVLKNIFPYYIWDYREVLEHLMLVPKRHIVTMEDFTDEEKKEYIDTICDYEEAGYSLYTRTSGNKSKSVGHLHTHLIKCSDREFMEIKYQKNPYISEPKFED